MPFEPAPKELSVAEKLAAMIEVGRATHPEYAHARGALIHNKSVCAMGFAMLGIGVDPNHSDSGEDLAAALGISYADMNEIAGGVVAMNDQRNASLEEIAAALREGTLPRGYVGFTGSIFIDEFPAVKWIAATKEVKPAVKSFTTTKVRTNTKTGATWPVAKHAYA